MRFNFICFHLVLVLTPGVLGQELVGRRVDAVVEAKLANGGAVNVVILAKEQLLPDREALGQFIEAHGDAKRLELRVEVIAQLKEMAGRFAGEMAVALSGGDEEGGEEEGMLRPLWLVNGVAGTVTSAQIEILAADDGVRFIYYAGRLPYESVKGSVSVVNAVVEQEAFTIEGKRVPWNVEGIGAARVWEELKEFGEGAVVAMYDVGVDYAHEDLAKNIWVNAGEVPNDGVDDDGNGLVDDYYGWDFGAWSPEVRATGARQHGTWTSGIVAGDGTGGIMTGVAPRAKLMPLEGGGVYSSIRTFEYALEMGADVISMSFSTPRLGNARGLWRLASEQGVCAGMVFVSGAGNFQQSQALPVQQRIPEGIPCVISAGGVTKKRKPWRNSSLGPVEWGSVHGYEDYPMPNGLVKPDVAGFPGPGFAILSTTGSGYIDPNDRRAGNSFSGPCAAGTAALMLGANADLLAWRVKEIMEATATDLGEAGKDNVTGAGLINAFAAVEAAIAERR